MPDKIDGPPPRSRRTLRPLANCSAQFAHALGKVLRAPVVDDGTSFFRILLKLSLNRTCTRNEWVARLWKARTCSVRATHNKSIC